ncbi:MAG: hypothetical protein KC620_26300, partial [Myxococcales bacterium]|nr:hypothetical protein [Myxococcales bacterium]
MRFILAFSIVLTVGCASVDAVDGGAPEGASCANALACAPGLDCMAAVCITPCATAFDCDGRACMEAPDDLGGWCAFQVSPSLDGPSPAPDPGTPSLPPAPPEAAPPPDEAAPPVQDPSMLPPKPEDPDA